MAFTTNSINNPNSRYVQGGTTDVYPNRLGWWDRTAIASATDDTTILLPAKYNLRPDLLAYDVYGKSVLQWVILQFNAIVDINTEFVTGATIVVPSSARVYSSILTQQTGGNVITTS